MINYTISNIELNLNGLCNLKCSFCPRAQDYPNANVHMSEETVELIASQIEEIPYRVLLILSGRGEPTLHNNYKKVVERLSAIPNANLSIITNGAKFWKHEEVAPLFDDIMYNVYSDDEQDFWQAIGHFKSRPNLKLKSIEMKTSDGKVAAHYNGKTREGKYVNKSMFLTNRSGHIDLDLPSPHDGFCSRPDYRVYIDWNGSYVLCCDDWSDTSMSSVYNETILKYFHDNIRLNAIREDLHKGIRRGVCTNCSYVDSSRR